MQMIHVRLVSPPDLTSQAIGLLTDDRYVFNLVVLPELAHNPDGDAIECDMLAGAANAVLRGLRELELDRRGSIVIEPVEMAFSGTAAEAEQQQLGALAHAPVWEEVEARIRAEGPTGGNAIHGLLRWVAWQVVEASDTRAVLEVPLWPQPGYPFHLRVRAEYTLGDSGLEVAVTARNLDTSAAPYGFGQHPYVTAGTAVVDQAVLTVPARTWLRTDERGLPVAAEPVAGTEYDLRTPRTVGALRLDTPFGDLDRDADGRAVVRLAHPSGAFGTDVWLGEGADHVQLYTGDTLPPGERRRAVAIEPMTCPPDAFRSGTGLVSLGPGEQHTVRWGITPWGE